MKTLLLLRHAKSDWDDPGLADHARPLAARGKEDAPRMGRWLKSQGLIPSYIVCSSAKRTYKTAKKVARHCDYQGPIDETDTLYLAPADRYLEYVRQLPDEHDLVLVVGHNPGLEDLLEMLTGRCERLSTACLAHVTLDITAWRDVPAAPTGNLVALWRPKDLPDLNGADPPVA